MPLGVAWRTQLWQQWCGGEHGGLSFRQKLLLHLHVDHLNDGDTTINGSTLQRGELPVLSSLLCCMYNATTL
jgi:hypothetical protein